MKKIQILALASILLGIGCDGGDPAVDGGPIGDACTTCADSGPPPTPDGGPPAGDGNDTFASADAIEVDAPEATGGVLNPPGDLDYYTFEGTEGQWVQIFTVANEDDDPEMVDTVITLYDSSMTQIAENDDSIPRVNTDSEILTRLPATGTYYVLVQEFTTWTGETDEGGSTFTYDLRVVELDDAAPAVNIDAEGGDDVASAQELSFFTGMGGGTFSLIVGDFDDATDVDVYSVTFASGGPYSYGINVLPSGADGTGSTTLPSRVWVTNADGTEIIARFAPSSDTELAPALPSGTYLVFVEHGPSAGANDFYVLKAFRGGDNPAESMEETNGVVATPEAISFADNPNAPMGFTRRSGFVLAQLGADDTDYFSVTLAATDLISVVCGSRTVGSGVVDLQIALQDVTGAMTLAMDTETTTEGALIEDEAVPSAGTYLVRMTKASQDPEVTGTYVRCGFHIDTPM